MESSGSHRMFRRNLQAAGGTGGTLFSALMLVIIVICFLTYCYRRSIYNFNNRRAVDVEVITETDAEVTECDINFAEVGACPVEDHENDTIAEIDRKKNIIEWFNNSRRRSISESPRLEVAVAVECDITRLSAGCTQARPIRVMESFRNSDLVMGRSGSPIDASSGGTTSVNGSPQQRQGGRFDHDFLIETERNMYEFNSDFVRMASANEAAEARAREVAGLGVASGGEGGVGGVEGLEGTDGRSAITPMGSDETGLNSMHVSLGMIPLPTCYPISQPCFTTNGTPIFTPQVIGRSIGTSTEVQSGQTTMGPINLMTPGQGMTPNQWIALNDRRPMCRLTIDGDRRAQHTSNDPCAQQ